MLEGKEWLLAALAEHRLAVIEQQGKMVVLEHGYTVEVEGPRLFKLVEDGYVVGPFDSAEELVAFVRRDVEENGG